MKNVFKFFPILFILIVFHQISPAQVHDFDSLYENDPSFKQSFEATSDSKDLFLSEDVMNITIESDFKNLVKKKSKEEYQPAVFRYFMNDTITLVRNITIRPRGLSRKNVCFFPPIKLNFPSEEMVVEEMKEFDKIKMVMDCKRGGIYEQYLLSEYLAYKVLNVLTDYSFRVRLVRVTYIDTGVKYKTETKYAFIIENKKQMAERLNTLAIDVKSVKDEYMEESTLVNTYLFEYLIGNTDWSIPASHNVQLLKSKDPVLTKPYVVPYDFDLAGIVDADYAFPNAEYGIESVRDRLYMGICLPESLIRDGLKIFNDKKDEIYAIYQNSLLIDKENKRSSIIYLNEFYKIIDTESSLQSKILEGCR